MKGKFTCPRKLKRLFNPPTRAKAPIEQLPLNVLHYIMDNIPPTEAAALSLTSKTMLSVAGPGILRIEESKDRAELLKHFEIHYPNHLLCYHCGKFFLRESSDTHDPEEETECDKKNGEFSLSPHDPIIPFTTVQEMMNRHRYGRRYGSESVRSLNSYDVYYEEDKPFDYASELTQARIVDGQLIIRKMIHFVSRRKGRDFKQSCQYCPHLTTSSFKVSEFDYSKTTFIRCLKCFTEIRWDRTRNFLYDLVGFCGRTRTTIWCNLGDCRSPFEANWQALTHSTDKDNNPSIYISRNDARYIHLF
ncbi:hypothetical protein FQN54_009698 [Arachnomyces sp. PD_36]|nr:hypothetical protein FQN54_009698 [Arachnomyces sp. PD_36]